MAHPPIPRPATLEESLQTVQMLVDRVEFLEQALKGWVTGDLIASHTVEGGNIAYYTITTDHLDVANFSITNAYIAEGTITSTEILNGTITLDDMSGTHVSSATIGTTAETEAAQTDTWDVTSQGANDGVEDTVLYRLAYDDTGDEKLYAYYRTKTYDSLGMLAAISAETRVTIDVPVEVSL